MNVLDLFSGIGGFSLGLERAGMRTVAFCEIEPHARAVLRKHWPDVPCYDDIKSLTADRLRADGIVPNVICGGFPCQDISFAGKGAGIDGDRSGLWSEYARIIGEVRPRYVIVENVSALLGRGLDRVLGDLAALGYDAEWHCIRAADVGAPHLRDRLWIIAYPQHSDANGERPHRAGVYEHGSSEFRDEQKRIAGPLREELADSEIIGWVSWWEGDATEVAGGRQSDRGGFSQDDLANAHKPRLERWLRESLRQCASERVAWENGTYADAYGEPSIGLTEPWGERGLWLVEPAVGRVANGIPARVDRLKRLGNAVVPQIPEIIGRAIMRVSDTSQLRPQGE
jgi:DNA (cytosine-5)-methyltransferase 1